MVKNLLNTKLPLDSPNQAFQIYLNRINPVLQIFLYSALIFTCISTFTLIVKGKFIAAIVLNTYLILFFIINNQFKIQKLFKEYKNDGESIDNIAFTLRERLDSGQSQIKQGIFYKNAEFIVDDGEEGLINDDGEEGLINDDGEEGLIVDDEEERLPILEIKEGLIEKTEVLLNTIQKNNDKGVLDFELIDTDIENILDTIKQNNVVILNTLVTINKPNEFIEIEIYTQEGNKMFKYKKIREFKNLSNLPSDVETELEKNGSVTLEILKITRIQKAKISNLPS